MSTTPPMREITKILELTGPRGGREYVLVLSCGCYLVQRQRPVKTVARCCACWVREQLRGSG